MNYNEYIKQIWDFSNRPAVNKVYPLFSDGYIGSFDLPSGSTLSTYDYLLYATEQSASLNRGFTPVSILFAWGDNTISLFNTNSVDFNYLYGSFGSINAYHVDNVDAPFTATGTYSAVSNYSQVNANNSFNDIESVGGFTFYSLSSKGVVYDYSNLVITNSDYTNDVVYLPTFGIGYYKSFLTFAPTLSFKVGYGRPYSDIRQNGYDLGYYQGYNNGQYDGYKTGYDNGKASAGLDNDTATAFTYIGGAFNAVSSIMSMEVLPHVTLGLCFSIPLVLILIMTIFKLIRK